jgi:hypothetical protein
MGRIGRSRRAGFKAHAFIEDERFKVGITE